MKAFIDRIFKAKKAKQESVQDQATEAAVEAIIAEVKKENKHVDCECRECIRRIKRAQYK